MTEFKVWQRVKIVSKVPNYPGAWIPDMDRYVGSVQTIYNINDMWGGTVVFKGISFSFPLSCIAPLKKNNKFNKGDVVSYNENLYEVISIDDKKAVVADIKNLSKKLDVNIKDLKIFYRTTNEE